MARQPRLYTALDKNAEQRQYAYRELFRLHLEPDDVHNIRDTLNRQLVLGRDDFKDKIEAMTNRQARPKPMGRPRIEENEVMYKIV